MVGLLLGIHAVLIAWQCTQWSVTVDEVGHLPAGGSVWEFGRFELYRVNPPLVKTLAALPAAVGSARVDWSGLKPSHFGRPEWRVGRDFIQANGDGWFRWFVWARWAVLPLSLLGGVVCYCWACELYGVPSGMLAVSLWSFSPNVLTWGSTITPDLGATALGVLAGWTYWRWLRSPSWECVFFAGVALGLAELAKMTLVVFFALWPILWVLWKLTNSRANVVVAPQPGPSLAGECGQLVGILLLGLYVLNMGYGFEGTFQSLGEYHFGSELLAGDETVVNQGAAGGNRFSDSWVGKARLPLPTKYLSGIDLQRIDFEQGRWSFLMGEWKPRGWWYYYLIAIGLKVPLGIWTAFLLTFVLTCGSLRYRSQWRDELILLLPAITILTLVSSQTGFSRYLRYLLPAFPFVFIWCGKLAVSLKHRQRGVAALAILAVVWSAASALWCYPHSLSYFNEIAKGPDGGHRFLLDGNIDWGQDLFYLKEWCDAHPNARPMEICCVSGVPLEHYDLQSDTADALSDELAPGWYAVSVHTLFEEGSRYKPLWTNFRPVEKAGYSIWIYRVTE